MSLLIFLLVLCGSGLLAASRLSETVQRRFPPRPQNRLLPRPGGGGNTVFRAKKPAAHLPMGPCHICGRSQKPGQPHSHP